MLNEFLHKFYRDYNVTPLALTLSTGENGFINKKEYFFRKRKLK